MVYDHDMLLVFRVAFLLLLFLLGWGRVHESMAEVLQSPYCMSLDTRVYTVAAWTLGTKNGCMIIQSTNS